MSKDQGLTRRGFLEGIGAAALGSTALMMGIGLKDANALPTPDKWDKTADAVIIGGGIAGVCAALEAAEGGKKVILLEAFSVTGGNSALSTGWFNAANSPIQQKLGIKDSADEFYKDSMELSNNRRDPAITKVVAEQGSSAIEWLMKHGITFLDVAEPAMGSPKPRAIQADGYGGGVVRTLASRCKEKGVEIITKARALNLYRKAAGDREMIAGVEAEISGKKVHIRASSVVIATGGFTNNKEMVERFLPEWTKSLVTGAATNVGDGFIMSCVEGADYVNMDRALVTPTLEVKTKKYLTSGALSGGAILVNEKGQRFTDELTGYTEVSTEMLKQQKVYEVMVEACHPKVKEFIDNKIAKGADSVEGLAEIIGVDAAALDKTIKEFNQATAGKAKDPFGRQTFRETLKPPLYAIQVLPVLLLTLGGLKIDTDARVLNIKNEVVLDGLYAAGEVTGGYIDYGYRTGDSMMYGTVFGIVAGRNITKKG